MPVVVGSFYMTPPTESATCHFGRFHRLGFSIRAFDGRLRRGFHTLLVLVLILFLLLVSEQQSLHHVLNCVENEWENIAILSLLSLYPEAPPLLAAGGCSCAFTGTEITCATVQHGWHRWVKSFSSFDLSHVTSLGLRPVREGHMTNDNIKHWQTDIPLSRRYFKKCQK